MKLLLVLNEKASERHLDVHNALTHLKTQKVLNDYFIYPFLEYRNQGITDNEINFEIFEIAKKFQPDLILWYHTGNLKINDWLIPEIRKINSNPAIGYRDGDIYQWFYKPLPKEAINLIKVCDVSFWPGYSKAIEKLRKRGCKDIRYVPNTTDEVRFSGKRNGTSIKYDVVIIGNLVKSKIPFKTFPGTQFREQLAQYFYKRLGSRFATFGEGWKGSFAQGKIPFNEQNKIYHQSRIVLATNNLHADYYFSNRFPIVLSSGVLIVHNYESGIEQLFKDIEYPYFYKEKEEAWNITNNLLAKPQQELDDIALKYREYVLKTLTMTNILKYMIDVLKDYKALKIKKMESIKKRENPWINVSQF